MSRSALWRQEGSIKERERRAEELYETACAYGRSRGTNNVLPLWGDDTTFHWNPLLLRNTIQSGYFQKCCQNLQDWNAVIDEIYYQVNHVQVFAHNKSPSTAFCLLLRLLTLRMTPQQLDQTLKHADSPYIRAIGFLYLRFAGPPDQILSWIEPYLLDDEDEFTVVKAEKQRGGRAKTITMGEYVRNLFSSREYNHGETTLPRFPGAVERELQVKMLAADKIAQRAQRHYKNASRMEHFQRVGATVMALYGDEENPLTWYKAVVDRVVTRNDETGARLKYPRFVVTFPEYGNTETVTLGELDVVGGVESSSDSIGGGSSSRGDREQQGYRGGGDRRGQRSRSRENEDDALYEEVRRRERERVAAAERGSWGRRPPSTKESLTTTNPHHHHRGGDSRRRENGVDARGYHDDRRYRGEEGEHHRPPRSSNHTNSDGEKAEEQQHSRSEVASTTAKPPPKKRSAEELAAIAEKKRRLMAKYG